MVGRAAGDVMTEQEEREHLWDMRHVLFAAHRVCLSLMDSCEVPDGVGNSLDEWGEAVGNLGDVYFERAKGQMVMGKQ